MTAAAIIEEIKSLPPEERAEVIQFVSGLEHEKEMGVEDLVAIAKHMVESEDPSEKERLWSEFRKGFYGQ